MTQASASLVAAAAVLACALTSALLAPLLRKCIGAWRSFVGDRPEPFEDGFYWSQGMTGRLGESDVFVPAALLASNPKRE